MANYIQNKIAEKSNNNNNTALAAANKTSVTVLMNNLLDSEGIRKRFDEILGKRAPQFVSSIVSLVNSDSKMQKAFFESPMTVIQAALKAATFDLPVDQSLGYAYIVPFDNYKKDLGVKKSEATFILGWKGMHQLAVRTGVYKTINVIDVREGELKSYNRLTEEIALDFIEDETERDALPVIGYVGYYKLINGTEKTIYRTVKQIENHEKRFRKGEYMGKGWRDNWDDMARKTVYRELIGKWGVMSIDYQSNQAAQNLADVMTNPIYDEPIPENVVVSEDIPETEGEANAESEAN